MMTSRQARKIRREQERKAKKAAYKASLQSQAAAAPVTLDDEFSPEFLAEANAMRQRIERRVAVMNHSAPPIAPDRTPARGFVSQNPESEPESAGFVSQTPPAGKTRAEINRANAAHSTGPRSSTGKFASSRNSLKHGLASGQLIIPGEDTAAFEALLNDLLADHQPANSTEEILIHQMAQSWWLTQRALRLQNECFTLDGVDEKRLSLFLRYQTTHERAFHKALNTLMRLQKDRHKSERTQPSGFVSQQRPSIRPEPGFVSQTHPLTDRQTAPISQNAPPSRPAEAA